MRAYVIARRWPLQDAIVGLKRIHLTWISGLLSSSNANRHGPIAALAIARARLLLHALACNAHLGRL